MNYTDEPKEDYFYNWLTNIFLPCGIVYSSQNAKNILSKNNITPSQFLRPFGDLKGVPLSFKINGNSNYINTLKDFKIDFYDAENFISNTKYNLNTLINFCLKHPDNIPLFDIYDIHVDKNNIEATLSRLNNFSFRYYNEIEKLIIEYCNFDDKEYYQQPFLFVFICDINDDPKIINKLKKDQEPYLLLNDIYENIHNPLIILLNDKNSVNYISDYNIIQKIMNSYRETFYSYPVYNFDINSASNKEISNNQNDFFSKYIHSIELYSINNSRIMRGKLMTISELSSIKLALKDYFKNTFIYNIQDIIIEIDGEIQKKKSFFGFEDKESKKNKNQSLTKLEKQIYILSIIQFYIRDYKNSFNNLDKLSDKIKDKKPLFEIPILQLKTIIEFIKSRKQKKLKILEPFEGYINILQNEIGAFRSLFIAIRMMESLSINNMEQLINNTIPYLYNTKINFLIPLIFEKLSYYFLIGNNPRLGKFAYTIIINIFTYFKRVKYNNDIVNTYLLHFLGSLFNIFLLNGSPNDNIHQSFSKIKQLLSFNMGLLCDKLGYYEGAINFYSKYIELFKILNGMNNIKMFNSYKDNINNIMTVFNNLVRICDGKNFFIDNYSIPQIDSNVIILTNQDLEILKNEFCCNFYKICIEYKELSVNEKYSLFNKEDFLSLKLIDFISKLVHFKEIENNYEKENKLHFSKNKFIVEVNEIISIRIILRNILPVDLTLTNVNLIFENINNKNIFLSENKNILMKQQSENIVILKGKFIETGNFTLKGISMRLFSSIEIRKTFYCDCTNFLYYEIENRNKNKFDILSNLLNKNQNYCYYFEVLLPENNIKITIANNEKAITIFNYEIYYLPIQIFNNYKNNEMKKFTIYLLSDDETLLYPKLVYNENNLTENNIIYIPIISLTSGKKSLNILIKFEERKEYIEVKRFLINFHVLKSVNLSFKNNIIEYNKNSFKQKIRISMNIYNKDNLNKIIFKEENEFCFRNQFKINSFTDWNAIGNEKYDKYYKTITIEEIHNNIKKKINIDLIKNIPFKENYNKKIVQKFFEKLINKNKKFLFFFDILNNLSKIKTFVYVNSLMSSNSIKEYNYNEHYFASIFEKCLNIEYKKEEINNNEYIIYLIIVFNFSKYQNYFFDNVSEIICKVKTNLHNFDWIGLKKYTINKFDCENKIKLNCIVNKNEKITFIKEEIEEININQIIYKIKLKDTNKQIILEEFPDPINISI